MESRSEKEQPLYYQYIYHSAPDAIIIINEDNAIIDWNEECTNLLGWRKSEIVGKSMLDTVIPQHHISHYLECIKHYTNTNNTKNIETINITATTKDNKEIPIALQIRKLNFNDKCTFIAHLHTPERIPELKESRQAIQFLQAVLSEMPASVAIIDVETKTYIYTNAGFDRAAKNLKFVGKTIGQIAAHYGHSEDMSAVNKVINTGQPINYPAFEFDGKYYDYSITKVNLGKELIILYASDVTDKVHAIQAELEYSERLKQVLKMKKVLLFQIDNDGIIIVWEGNTDSFPVPALNRHYSQVFQEYPDIISDIDNLEDYSIRQINIRNHWYEMNYSHVNSHIIAIIKNIDQIKQYEKERNEAYQREESAIQRARLQTEFLNNMNHELRTPLTGISGMVELLKDTPLKTDQRQYLDTLEASTELLKSTVNSILDIFIQKDERVSELVLGDFDVVELVRDLSRIFEFNAKQKKIEFKCIGPEKTLWVTSDPHKIRQILSNLLGNSIKFTEKGTVELQYEFTEDKMIFNIIDTGIGIEEENKPLLFKPFIKLQENNTTGLGLGLYITKNLVHNLNGDINFKSTLGVGSVFTVVLPFKIFSGQPLTTFTNNREHKQVINILVAEDNPINQQIILKTMEKVGFIAIGVPNGLEALKEIERHPNNYDVILMDCQMPVLNGYEATKQIRERQINIPIIAVTANALSDRERCIRYGMNDYLAKPYKREELINLIRKWVT